MTILRTGRGFGMILHAEDRPVFNAQAAIRAIKKADMSFLQMIGQAVALDGPAMIHRDDFHLTGQQIFNRMISAMMSLVHFFSLRSERQSQHLMAEADSKNRDVGGGEVLDHRNGIGGAGGGRIAGPVG